MFTGACVCLCSRWQIGGTLSIAEVEYVALVDTIKEAMFMRYLWSFIVLDFGARCITVFDDNKEAGHLAQNPVCTSNSKHVGVRHHFMRELVLRRDFNIAHVES